MTDPTALNALIDPSSATLRDARIHADLIVQDEHARHVFYVTWQPGHAQDWQWQGDASWLQTELNAEHLGLDPAQLIALADRAVAQAAALGLDQPARGPAAAA